MQQCTTLGTELPRQVMPEGVVRKQLPRHAVGRHKFATIVHTGAWVGTPGARMVQSDEFV